jgi:hypothetical protein
MICLAQLEQRASAQTANQVAVEVAISQVSPVTLFLDNFQDFRDEEIKKHQFPFLNVELISP